MNKIYEYDFLGSIVTLTAYGIKLIGWIGGIIIYTSKNTASIIDEPYEFMFGKYKSFLFVIIANLIANNVFYIYKRLKAFIDNKIDYRKFKRYFRISVIGGAIIFSSLFVTILFNISTLKMSEVWIPIILLVPFLPFGLLQKKIYDKYIK